MDILDKSFSECGAKVQKLKALLETLHDIQTEENQDVEENTVKILKIIKESGQIVQNSVHPSEMIMDAKILHGGTVFCSSSISMLNTHLTSFDEEKYINEVLNYMQSSYEITPTGNKWQKLAPLTYHLFRKSEPITSMLGSISFKPLTTQEKKKIVRQKKTAQPEKKLLETLEIKEKQEEEESDFCEHLFMWLVRHYKHNDKKAINYFTFIVDPLSFWRTIENIFYFAFLVRDGNVKIFVENGLPHIEPILKKSENPNIAKSNSQFCFTLNITEWKKIIKKFQIISPGFPPFEKNKSSKRHKT